MVKHLPQHNGQRAEPSIVKSVASHLSTIDRYLIKEALGCPFFICCTNLLPKLFSTNGRNLLFCVEDYRVKKKQEGL